MKKPHLPFPTCNGRPDYSHLPYTIIFPVYLLLFFLTERVVTDHYWVSYISLDDAIPFCEWFVIPYILWYPFLIITGLYLMFHDAVAYKRYMLYIAVGFYGACMIYLIFPNGQDLRPAQMPKDNFLTEILSWLYAHDTNTNVLPSTHVIGSMGACFAVFHTKTIHAQWVKVLTVLLAVIISISTAFVKQHSILDFLVAIPFSLFVYWIVYWVGWPKLRAAAKGTPPHQ